MRNMTVVLWPCYSHTTELPQRSKVTCANSTHSLYMLQIPGNATAKRWVSGQYKASVHSVSRSSVYQYCRWYGGCLDKV